MGKNKEVIGGPLVINGRQLSLSKAVRAGDFIFLTGQVPMKDGVTITEGTIEEQTRICIELIQETLKEAGCSLNDVVKSMVWLKDRDDFPGFNSIFPVMGIALIILSEKNLFLKYDSFVKLNTIQVK